MVKASDNQSWVKCRIFGQLKHCQRIINPNRMMGLKPEGFMRPGKPRWTWKPPWSSCPSQPIRWGEGRGPAALGPSGDWLFPVAEKVNLSPVRWVKLNQSYRKYKRETERRWDRYIVHPHKYRQKDPIYIYLDSRVLNRLHLLEHIPKSYPIPRDLRPGLPLFARTTTRPPSSSDASKPTWWCLGKNSANKR